MRYFLVLVYFFLFQANGHQFEKNDIIIKQPIIKVNKNSSKVGAGYFKIINNSQKRIFLLGIESKVSDKQEVHEVIEDNNVFKMRPLKKSLLIEPGTFIEFKPQSYHVMFLRLNTVLDSNEMVEATLNFDDNFFIPIKFKVIINQAKHNHH
ncbi:copper chaperone PCu(A)C [Alphaproteobacteria bacterium]|nr:copper chaperone PCu(A)C [Alphaproteobacteria bacterium]